MLSCSTICPNCRHQFACCPPVTSCCAPRRSVHILSGGGIVVPSSPPQVSPSAPITFVLPPYAPPPQPPPPEIHQETDLARLSATVRALRQSGWYYEGLTYQRSDDLLKNTEVGTFLVRNSADPRYLFSLSMQTECGPKSVRLFYTNGFFRLDAQAHLQEVMPLFPGVVELVEHYVAKKRSNPAQVWVDPQGKLITSIYLAQPLRREGRAPSLKHLARLAINRALRGGAGNPMLGLVQLELPQQLAGFVADYPYGL